MSGLLGFVRLVGATFAVAALGMAAVALAGPDAVRRLGVGAASAAAATPPPALNEGLAAADPNAPPLSAELVIIAPKVTGADVLALAERASIDRTGPALDRVTYARLRTTLDLRGAADSWWMQAAGRYQRSHAPQSGAVLVLGGAAGGHVAVVSRVLNQREILVDHADWEGGGEIVRGALVRDVSGVGDWSAVRVWSASEGALGRRVHPASGFIHADPEA
ncbi:MAG: CHAP domain-containing protein [Hyphomonadaceae bacterium]|nr:CHAP domain-containing protein [Hyphomonadaceae bacterium]